MQAESINAALEAILFASGNAISLKHISEIMNIPINSVRNYMEKLIDKFDSIDSGIKIIKINDKYQMCSNSKYVDYVRKALNINKCSPLSSAAMEVLAIIAYKQPITKRLIQNIRGVDCSNVINSLIQKELITESGRLDITGRPIIYSVTENFFRCFGISSLDELPKILDSEEDVEV